MVHDVSTSTSPVDCKYHFIIGINPLGNWARSINGCCEFRGIRSIPKKIEWERLFKESLNLKSASPLAVDDFVDGHQFQFDLVLGRSASEVAAALRVHRLVQAGRRRVGVRVLSGETKDVLSSLARH